MTHLRHPVCVLAAFLLSTAVLASPEDTTSLTTEPVEREIAGGQSHAYTVELEANHQVRVVVEQRGIDLVVAGFAPGGERLNEVDSPNGAQGPEVLTLTAPAPGVYRVEVRPLDDGSAAGRYEIRIAEVLSPAQLAAQEKERQAREQAAADWLRENAIPLRGAAPGQGFEDMQALRPVVGDARVVALGEATHGTREFFQLKHRMLEFLVEEMGFTVFGIEATMPEGFDVNDYVVNGRGNAAEALSGLYFWTWDTEEVLAMIEWMRRYNAEAGHERKVKFYGFDMQSAPRAARIALGYLDEVDPASAASAREVLSDLADPFLTEETVHAASVKEARKAAADALVARFDEKRDEYVRRTGESRWALARQHARVLAQKTELDLDFRKAFIVRDRSMAENALWLLEHEGLEAKMVLWAHNGHVQTTELFPGTSAMGVHLRRALGDDLVVFGFAFHQGGFQAYSPGRSLEGFEVAPAPPGSLDATLAAGLDVAVIDLRALPDAGPVAEWFGEGHKTRSFGAMYNPAAAENFFSEQKVQEQYDALFFVETTTRARPNAGGTRPKGETFAATTNGDFEEAGDTPASWTFREKFGYRVRVSDEGAKSGGRCAVLSRPHRDHYGETAGLLHQSLDATSFQGKQVRLRAAARVSDGSVAYVWIRVRRPGFGPAAEGFSGHRRVSSGPWQEVEIAGGVQGDAISITYGLALSGDGEARLDDVRLEVVEPTP